MEQSDFDKLLHRYLSNQVSEEEKTKIEAWLEIKKTESPNLVLSNEDEAKIFSKIKASIKNPETEVFSAPKKRNSSFGLRMAAGFLLLSALSAILWYSQRPNVDKRILNDGSLVWLRNKSELSFYENQDEHKRFAELKGEALFEVTKDPNRPFFLTCGPLTIKVLGTSFSVKSSQDQVELFVLTGKVNISSPSDSIGIDVTPNEKVIFSTTTASFLKSSITQQDKATLTTDTEYNMQFTNTSLQSITEKMEEKFGVKITLTDKRAGACRITADFTDHSLETTLQMIAEVVDVQYVRTGTKISITGNACN